MRQTKQADYQLVPFPLTQRVIAILQRLAEHKHIIHAFTEVDVTTARQTIQEQKARGEWNSLDHRTGHDGVLQRLGGPHRHAASLLWGGRDCEEAKAAVGPLSS